MEVKMKRKINKNKINKIFNSFKRNDLLEDRVEYDKEDLHLAYPQLNKSESKRLYTKLQRWKKPRKFNLSPSTKHIPTFGGIRVISKNGIKKIRKVKEKGGFQF
jgi:hypothetical protein